MSSIREKILNAPKRQKDLYVHEWDTTVYLYPLTARQRLEMQEASKGADGVEAIAKLVIHSVRDTEGNKVFNADDVVALTESDGAALERVSTAIFALNGLLPGAEEDAAKKPGARDGVS